MLIRAPNQSLDKGRLINLLASYGIQARVLEAFEATSREKFVPRGFFKFAYEDRALPIGEGQTISQPSLVASMIQALKLTGEEKVLEIGTGSGFQAALLSRLVKKVYSIERIEELASVAAKRLKNLGVGNVLVVKGDGSKGLPRHAPYDAVIVSAGFKEVPKPLVQQLKNGGRLIMPIGKYDWQEVFVYEKKENRLVEKRRIAPVRFVPLIGKYAWSNSAD